jgi:hypothetical protein
MIKKKPTKQYVINNRRKFWTELYDTFKRHCVTWPNSHYWPMKRDEAAKEMIKLGVTPT